MTLRLSRYRHVGFIMTTAACTYYCLPSFAFPFPVPFSFQSQHLGFTCVFNLGLSQCEIPAELYCEQSVKLLVDAWAKFLLISKPWLCLDGDFSVWSTFAPQQYVVAVPAGVEASSCTGHLYSA